MQIIDSNKIDAQTIQSDVCIIGAGPAGVSLAASMADSNLDIIIAESGGKKFDKTPNELNCLNTESNFSNRQSKDLRVRQIGGTATVWAGRVVPFTFHPEFDEEWNGLKEAVLPFYEDAFRLFGINPELQKKHKYSNSELYAYWGHKTERFNTGSKILNGQMNCRIYQYLTCTGEPEFGGEQISSLSFVNQQQAQFNIQSRCFVFAMGSIENSRMLLTLGEHFEKHNRSQLKNAGKYIMDHPRIWHGSVSPEDQSAELSRFQLKTTDYGFYKTGIRNRAVITRVYCNLMKPVSRTISLLQQIPVHSFRVSSKKLILREKGALRFSAGECAGLPLLRRSTRFKNLLMDFFNKDPHQDYHVMTYCEQRPRAENKLVLDNDTDRHNLRIPKLINNIHRDELNEVLEFYKALKSLAATMKCGFVFDPDSVTNPAAYGDAAHISGGTRFSSDKSKAVVGADLSVTGIPNLHITGSSVFPTVGVENPTHMIVSLSCYLASVLKKKYS